MEFRTLRDAGFTLLDKAVTDWSTLVKSLEELKEDAEDNLRKRAARADWAGVNAKVSKEFIGKTAGEFADAHTQAKSIYEILSDTVGELKRYRQQLVDAIEGGRRKNLRVIGHEGGFTVTTNAPPEARSAMDQDHEGDITALRDEIQGILDKATDSDDSARTVLQALADRSELGFSDAGYADRDSAAEALRQADRLAALAKKDPDDLSVEDFGRINAGLKKYAGDELFAERFATTLGPKKALEFWAGVSDPHRGNWELGRDRLDQFDDLQRNLGLTLANATRSDSAAMADWKRTVIDIGDRPIHGNHGGPMGFQVMSNLMRTGDYDDRFLEDYGTKLMATERRLTGNGAYPNPVWRGGPATPWLNRIGEDGGADPLTGYLKGLSNSPDAATGFFNQRFVSKDDPNNPFERDTDGNGKKEKASLSNFQYLFEERDWPRESDSKGDDLHAGQNNLALALEAATTGHPAGELPTADTPAHNSGQAKLFENIVTSISEDPERLTKNSYMSDSIGQIASEYLPDINRAATGVDPHPEKGDLDARRAWEQIKNLYPVAGSAAEVNHRDASRFLFTVAQDPEGYAAVEVGQKNYMAGLMDHHLNPDLPESRRPHHDKELTVRSIAWNSGEVSGTLAMGRNEAVAVGSVELDEQYDHSMAQWKNTVSGAIGLGVGVGTSFIASPVAGAVVGGTTGTVTSVVMEQFFKDLEGDAKGSAGPTMGENWENGQENNMKYTRRAASEAARTHDHANPDDVAGWAQEESRKGFLSAGDYMERFAPELVTDI